MRPSDWSLQLLPLDFLSTTFIVVLFSILLLSIYVTISAVYLCLQGRNYVIYFYTSQTNHRAWHTIGTGGVFVKGTVNKCVGELMNYWHWDPEGASTCWDHRVNFSFKFICIRNFYLLCSVLQLKKTHLACSLLNKFNWKNDSC